VVSSNLRWPGAHYAMAMSDLQHGRTMPAGWHMEEGINTCRLEVTQDVAGRLFLRGLGGAIRKFRPDVSMHILLLTPMTFRVASLRD